MSPLRSSPPHLTPTARETAESVAASDPPARPRGSDQQLVRAAQAGDLDAFGELTRRHAREVNRWAFAILRNEQDSQDVTQEAFLNAWLAMERFRADCAFTSWMYPIVTRLALNSVRQRRVTAVIDHQSHLAEPRGGPEDLAVQARTSDAVLTAVGRLPPAQRAVVTLHHLGGLPYSEIASVTSSTIPAVRSHLYRGRRTLAASLAPWR
jgi:RNA polymerase sigma-70 factor, ECF subfamily